MNKSALMLAIAVLVSTPVLASPVALYGNQNNPGTLTLYLENDLFADTDQQYTNGVRASWTSPDLTSYLDDKRLPVWARRYNEYITSPLGIFDETPPKQDEIVRNLVITLGQQMYTPEDNLRTTIDPDDRPYAGWLYLGMGYHLKHKQRMDSAIFNVGVVGPAAMAQEAQDFIHDLRGIDKFNGWDNQLSNELGLQLVYERKYRVPTKRISGALEYDVIWHGGASLGNVATYLNVGAELRLGWFLPDDFGTSSLRPGGDNSAPGSNDPRIINGTGYSKDNNFGLHGFVAVDGRWVLRDIFLDGSTFSNSHSVDKENWVGDLSVGASMLIDDWKISYSQVYRSQEFKTQQDTHSFGSLSVSYSF
ncbi:lipid A deacylase LpxR family protein [Amphritea balenae]|uniref:Lipid A deacylase LpxR family protein n=1 Tax=Amphritea balenae TaxID=452629 RepID=A0A3P1SYU0_9GAMM|nr:lipid A deacylase LpxR family protein [Amphritea balenae]RRD01716.1 lipid A deacylase LpxR family protein [Amphritea balenae]GGK54742.1 membrane protein [Amphritea balenae]